MPPYYYDPSAGHYGRHRRWDIFQPAQSICTTVVTLLVVGLAFDLGQKAIEFLTSVLVAQLKVNKTYEEGTVEYQWIRAFLTQKRKWPDAYGKPYTIENHTTNLWWNGTWMSAIQCNRKDTYYSFAQQNEIPKPYIDLTLYSLKSSAISSLLREAKRQYDEIRHHDVTVYSHKFGQIQPGYSSDTQNWSDKKELPARMMDSTSLPIQALTSLVEEARDFFESETWYNEAGIPWQKRYLLHGPSGSGKRGVMLLCRSRKTGSRGLHTLLEIP
ncbi:hypothetical protein BJ912DRAFT_924307 [Pholiota molesta]|nr:hypothetical protein BJ912DRAFT_924307 [Pholiota molesta]